MWKLSNTVINCSWNKTKTMIRKVRKYFELKENENTLQQNLWDYWLGMVAHNYNPSYLRGRDGEDHGLRSGQVRQKVSKTPSQ
jgi:hypothetical protein